jgi:MFS superfamily sulfate permease-like transporter
MSVNADHLPAPNRKISLLSEISGSVADFGTILPLLLAVSLVCGMDLPLMTTGIGICYILSGIYYRIPVSVEPLKVVASVAIAQHLLPEEIAAAGILTGLVFIGIGLTGMMGYLQERIPEPVIRGIQLGLGLILLRTAFTDFVIQSPVSTAVFTGVILLFLFLRWRYHTPDLSAILVIISGFGILFLTTGLPGVYTLPVPHLTLPPVAALVSAGLFIVPAQFPLTLTNAILST